MVRRGRGPWPVTNGESDVLSWLERRLQAVEEEQTSMARWMLDAASGLPRGARMAASHRWSESALDRLAVWADRVSEGEPLQYVLGEVEFGGLSLRVTPDVLIPRPETEELVVAMAHIISSTPRAGARPLVVDWCTGSGCIALALKKRFPWVEVQGVDLSEAALGVAQSNAQRCGLDVTFRRDDLRAPSWKGVGASWVVANPPYIPESESAAMAPRVVDHEPRLALFVPDNEPLGMVESLWAWCEDGGLASNGVLGVECHTDMVADVAKLWEARDGWKHVEILVDLQGKPRHVIGHWCVPSNHGSQGPH
ncbi:MAG: peptide chain release factor N(5)-glutamine methyltransferase [Bacteroidetes bacterium]|nr:peptide chain release factor N(5)-glutamine methyltransferase [Bacteroidota bacterium]MDA0904186.1 peptide chain release factor N(5)-glutamine methyltransferase [Bacteroidota bacterium]MDA1242936.1 peptide chain release factor N(5)-glutamine methyltransferase [Bacteroidota bacterium]